MQQLPEIILLDDVLHSLYTTPLKPWLFKQPAPPVFDRRAPTCARGYIGSWKIRQDRLWLIGLYAWRGGVSTGVSDLFDGRREVIADWFVGPLVVEPASAEILGGALPKVKTLFVDAGRVVSARDGAAELNESGPT